MYLYKTPPENPGTTVTGLKGFKVPELLSRSSQRISDLYEANREFYTLEHLPSRQRRWPHIRPVVTIPGFNWKSSGLVDVYSNELGTYEFDRRHDFSDGDFALVTLLRPFTPYVLCNWSVVKTSSYEVFPVRTSVLYIGERTAEYGKELKRFFEDADLAKRYKWEYRVCQSRSDKEKVARLLVNGRTDDHIMINGVYGCSRDCKLRLSWKCVPLFL